MNTPESRQDTGTWRIGLGTITSAGFAEHTRGNSRWCPVSCQLHQVLANFGTVEDCAVYETHALITITRPQRETWATALPASITDFIKRFDEGETPAVIQGTELELMTLNRFGTERPDITL